VLKSLQDAIRAICEISLLVPMPWRAGLVILVAVLLLYWLVWRLLPWLIEKLAHLLLFSVEGIASLLLLPEYLITKKLRQGGRQPLPGAYGFGGILQWIVGLIHAGTTKLTDVLEKQWRLSRWWAVLVVLIVATLTLLWYVRPFLNETVAATYIDQGAAWWYSLEGWALTGRWTSPSQVLPTIKPGVTSPTPSDRTVTPSPATMPRATFTPTTGPMRTRTVTPAYRTYIVQPGDSLSKIAKDFGVSVEDLVATNKVKYPSLVTDTARIEVGWELLVPERK
jgi:LysM repeat protein